MSELPPSANTPMLCVPRFDIKGHPDTSAEEAALLGLDYAKRIRSVEHFPEELPFPDGRNEELKNITGALGSFLLDRGVQIAPEKMPQPRKFHFFEDNAAMLRASGEKGERYEAASGICDGSNIYVIERRGSLSTASHEAIHFMAYESFRIKPIEKRIFLRKRTLQVPYPVRSGYQLLPNENAGVRFDLMHELVIEMTNIFVQQKYWGEYPNLPVEAQFAPGYIVSLIIGEEMIKKTAKNEGVSPKDVFLPLSKGIFTGDMKAMRAVSKAIGTTGFKAIAAAQVSGGGFERGFELAARVGVPEVKARFDAAEESGVLPAFEWM